MKHAARVRCYLPSEKPINLLFIITSFFFYCNDKAILTSCVVGRTKLATDKVFSPYVVSVTHAVLSQVSRNCKPAAEEIKTRF